MPFGLPKNIDTPANNAKMERCVKDRMNDPKFKPRGTDDKKTAAIKVCKDSIIAAAKLEENPLIIEADVLHLSDSIKDNLFEKEILKTGEWQHPQAAGLKLKISEDDLDQIVNNFETIKPEVPVPFGTPHNVPNLGEGVAETKYNAGWVKKLFRKGNKLIAHVQVLSLEALNKIKDKTVRNVSVSLQYNYKDKKTGANKGTTLLHLLLTNRPFLDLEPKFREVALEEKTNPFVLLTPLNMKEKTKLEEKEETSPKKSSAPEEESSEKDSDTKTEDKEEKEASSSEKVDAEDKPKEESKEDSKEDSEETDADEGREDDAGLNKKERAELEELRGKQTTNEWEKFLREGKVVPAQEKPIKALLSLKSSETVQLEEGGKKKDIPTLIREVIKLQPKLDLEEKGKTDEKKIELDEKDRAAVEELKRIDVDEPEEKMVEAGKHIKK